MSARCAFNCASWDCRCAYCLVFVVVDGVWDAVVVDVGRIEARV